VVVGGKVVVVVTVDNVGVVNGVVIAGVVAVVG